MTDTATLHIQTAAELFEAVCSSDMLTRLSVLEATCADPEGALSLGQYGGQDLIGLLCQELEQSFTLEFRAYLLSALCAMPKDPRIGACLQRVWFFSDEIIEQISAASWLLEDNDPEAVLHLRAALLGDNPTRAEAIASIWQPRPDDTAAVQLRLGLICPDRHAVPSLESNLGLWSLELQGIFADLARAVLEIQPEQTLDLLAPRFATLSPSCQDWLLQLAMQTNSKHLAMLTEQALEHEHSRLLALEAARQTSSATIQTQLEHFANHSPDPSVQAAAIRAGASGDNRKRALAVQDRSVRIAAIRQLKDPNTLLELLTDPDWRIRSVATEQLQTLGADVLPLLEPMLIHERLEVRMAATMATMEQVLA